MHSLLYISNSTSLFSKEDIIDILKTCRSYCKKFNVTGLLLYHEGSILHILEGEKENVHDFFYNKISIDKRQKGLIIMLNDEIEKRSFTDWSMGFKKLQNHEWSKLEGYLNIGNRKEFSTFVNSLSPNIISMIKSFSDVNQLSI